MKFLKSIRWRLQFWHGLFLIAVFSAFGMRLYTVDRNSRMQLIDQGLQRQLIFVGSVLKDTEHSEQIRQAAKRALTDSMPKTADPHREKSISGIGEQSSKEAVLDAVAQTGSYYVCWSPEGEILFKSDWTPPDLTPPPGDVSQMFLARTRGEYREQISVIAGGPRLLVGRSLKSDFAEMRQYVREKLVVIALMMGFGLFGGWWLVTRAIKPIKDISRTAEEIASGRLAARINVSETDSELGQLAGILNRSFDRVQEAFVEMQESMDSQVRFVADASHELRTPVAAVLAEASSALAKERNPAEYRDSLEACGNIARRMRKLVESLLLLARVESGTEDCGPASCDLSEATSQSLQDLEGLAMEKSVALEGDLSPGRCQGHPELLRLLAGNLVENAIHYNRPGGRVAVRVWSEVEAVCLRVTDDGQGIPAESLPYIFDRFYRVDQARSSTSGRFGLGLALCKLITDCHSGTITVTSELEMGSTFTVRLPRTHKGEGSHSGSCAPTSAIR